MQMNSKYLLDFLRKKLPGVNVRIHDIDSIGVEFNISPEEFSKQLKDGIMDSMTVTEKLDLFKKLTPKAILDQFKSDEDILWYLNDPLNWK